MMNFTSRQEAEAGHRASEHKGDCGRRSWGVTAVVPEGPASCFLIALLPFFLSKWVPISLLTKSSHVTQFWTLGCWQHSVQGVGSKKTLKGKKYALFLVPSSFYGWNEYKILEACAAVVEEQVLGTAEQRKARRYVGPHDFVETLIVLDLLPSDCSHVWQEKKLLFCSSCYYFIFSVSHIWTQS